MPACGWSLHAIDQGPVIAFLHTKFLYCAAVSVHAAVWFEVIALSDWPDMHLMCNAVQTPFALYSERERLIPENQHNIYHNSRVSFIQCWLQAQHIQQPSINYIEFLQL